MTHIAFHTFADSLRDRGYSLLLIGVKESDDKVGSDVVLFTENDQSKEKTMAMLTEAIDVQIFSSNPLGEA